MNALSLPRAATAALMIGLAPISIATVSAETPANAGLIEAPTLTSGSLPLGQDGPTVSPALAREHEAVRAFYAQRLDAPVWYDAGGWTPAASVAIETAPRG